ncbi:uncharacterized protein LOC143424874 [Xylocopa sonorina]|uniref:uncharacterized protein LOC143424874 n=1 Tax=Xylocopa sonorina TaxID=1818115 RepID=UPI00403A8362
MYDLCPLCLKNGVKKKVKLLQINLQEAVRICEEEKCLWPFGYEDLIFYPRVVGKIWSCYWDDHKATTKFKETTITPTKSLTCDASIKWNKDTSKEFIVNSDTHFSADIKIPSNDSNVIDTENVFNDLSISTSEQPNIPSHTKSEDHCYKDDILKKEITNNASLNNSNLQLTDSNTDSTKIETEHINSFNKHAKEQTNIPIKNSKDVKETPKITSIEKTNIDISTVKIANQICVYQDPKKSVSDINKSVDIIDTKLLNAEKSQNIKSIKNNETSIKGNLNVTKMEIDGLPPIILSFELPVSTASPQIVTTNVEQTAHKNNNSPENKKSIAKRSLTSGKQYQKFSFNDLKKKMKSKITSTNSNGNNSSNINPKIQKLESDLTSNIKKEDSNENYHNPNIVNFNNAPNQLDNSICNLINQEGVTFETVNIHSVLEDFLTDDYSVSDDINDDWIDSLLN